MIYQVNMVRAKPLRYNGIQNKIAGGDMKRKLKLKGMPQMSYITLTD